MRKKSLLAVLLLLFPALMFGQAKKPTIMVVPADVWCNNNGYMTTYTNQGETTKTPDYERALQENQDLVNVITKIGGLMTDRGLPLQDLSQTLSSIRQENAEDALMSSKTSGAELAETPYERLLRQAKADIIIELTWSINSVGPRRSVTYTLRGLDAYTNKQVAAVQGTGAPSLTAETPVLLEEAVLERMDGFVQQLQAHFDDLLANGREVRINIKVFDNGSGLSLEDEYGDDELTDVIENWMSDNTVQHRFTTSSATENSLRLEQVRIPLYDEKGRPNDTRRFCRSLAKYLKEPPYNIECKVTAQGLGRCTVVLGEK